MPGTVNAATLKDVVATTLIGLKVGDTISLNPTTAPSANVAMVAAWISATDELTHRWVNPTAGNIAAAPQNYTLRVNRAKP